MAQSADLLLSFFVPRLALGGAEQDEDDGRRGQDGGAQQEGDPPLSQCLLPDIVSRFRRQERDGCNVTM